jgi:hypothetical protein
MSLALSSELERFHTIREVAELLGYEKSSIYNLVNEEEETWHIATLLKAKRTDASGKVRGRLRCVKIGARQPYTALGGLGVGRQECQAARRVSLP